MASASGVSNDELLDLLKTTLPNLPQLEVEVALTYQNYPFCNHMLKEGKKQFEGGTQIVRNIQLNPSGAAKFVRPYQKVPRNVEDVQSQMKAPWTIVQTDWSIERAEMMRNRGPARFVNLLKSRRQASMLGLADLLEQRAFLAPVNTTDDLNPQGVPYWLSMLPSGGTTAGFLGYTVRFADGSTTSTTKGGIVSDATTNTNWANYAAIRPAALNADMIKTLRMAFLKTHFQSPILATDLVKGPLSNFRMYACAQDIVDYETFAIEANENVGFDMQPFQGQTAFKRVPIIYAPVLDGVTFTPFYGVNYSHFFPFVQEGNWLREENPAPTAEQVDTFTTVVIGAYNMACDNVREGGFVLHTTTNW